MKCTEQENNKKGKKKRKAKDAIEPDEIEHRDVQDSSEPCHNTEFNLQQRTGEYEWKEMKDMVSTLTPTLRMFLYTSSSWEVLVKIITGDLTIAQKIMGNIDKDGKLVKSNYMQRKYKKQ